MASSKIADTLQARRMRSKGKSLPASGELASICLYDPRAGIIVAHNLLAAESA
jgi:hypothetical protein